MKKLVIFVFATIALMGCKNGEGFLDKNPDMRASIDTKQKVQLLLVSAYTEGCTAPILDFTSDNVIDNDAPDKTGHCRNLLPLDKMYDEIFGWEPVVSSGQQDSPKYLWDAHYSAIAAANQALQAIEKLEAQGIDMTAEKAEAKMIRAYHHFLLTMVFCQAWRNAELSKQDLGVVYMTAPETAVKPHYDRPSLAETYACIEKDLEEALPNISDGYYSVPKYHFNVAAANAFAARFYLYTRQWEKAIVCANAVLGTDDATTLSKLFDHYYEHIETTDIEQSMNAWIDIKSPSNLLLHTTMTQAPYSNFPDYGRYQSKDDALKYSLEGAGPCWGNRALIGAMSIWSVGSDQYGSFLSKFYYKFEYTDKVNGYGYIHGVTRAFTSDETLLVRAEARVYAGDEEGAINDLRLWCENMNVRKRVMNINPDSTVALNYNIISDFYTKNYGTPYAPELHQEEVVPGWEISERQLPLVHCCLHFRRIETFHDGLRLQDLKRYGIVFTHKQGTKPEMTMEVRDERLAIQLPQEVMLAGMTPNPRTKQSTPTSGSVVTTAPTDSLAKNLPPVGLGTPIMVTK